MDISVIEARIKSLHAAMITTTDSMQALALAAEIARLEQIVLYANA